MDKNIQEKIEEVQSKINEMQDKLEELKRVAAREDNLNFRRHEGGNYFFINNYGATMPGTDDGLILTQSRYAAANYCHDQCLMKKRAAEETLSRLIWREAEIANTGREQTRNWKHIITYDSGLKAVER